MIQLEITPDGRELLASGKGFSYVKMVAGAGSGYTEIADAKQDVTIANVIYRKEGETYTVNGRPVIPRYTEVIITANLQPSNASERYMLTELSLIAQDDEDNVITMAYGTDSNYRLEINPNDSITIALSLSLIFSQSPSITIKQTEQGVSYSQFSEHTEGSISNDYRHGLRYENEDFIVDNVPVGILNQDTFKATMGIMAIVTENPTPESYMEGWLIFNKTTNLLYRCENSNWVFVSNFDTRISNSSGGSVNERKTSTAYSLEDIVTVSSFKSYKYLECVVAGTSSSGNIINESNVGQLIYDGTVKWLVCDIRDASPVASIKYDYSVRPGWVKCNGAVLAGNGYPRLLNYLKNHLATTFNYASLDDATEYARQQQNNNPGRFFLAHGTTLDAYNIILPDLTGRFIEGADSAGTAIDAGLPNIAGYAEIDGYGAGGILSNSNGVFSLNKNHQVFAITVHTDVQQANRYKGLNFSASDSNSIYGRSTTVQPPAIQMIPLIKY